MRSELLLSLFEDPTMLKPPCALLNILLSVSWLPFELIWMPTRVFPFPESDELLERVLVAAVTRIPFLPFWLTVLLETVLRVADTRTPLPVLFRMVVPDRLLLPPAS